MERGERENYGDEWLMKEDYLILSVARKRELSNLLDAIRALNVASRELSGSFFVAGRDR